MTRPLPAQHRAAPGGDALRTLALGITLSASVPDRVWDDLSAPQAYELREWHGDVA